ncbi:MAG: hypothetical protein CSB33_01075 [Desulfobacterales bacterium]|nr:MAG: hypothetical protein CSB33_01075 [Desulfobacterales bacterium]
MQPRLRIKILPRRPKIGFNISDQKPSLTKRQIADFPNHRTGSINHFFPKKDILNQAHAGFQGLIDRLMR